MFVKIWRWHLVAGTVTIYSESVESDDTWSETSLLNSYISTLQSVLPAYYKLRNSWSEHLTTDSAAGRILKRNLVLALDGKMWVDINALRVAASYLNPSLKSFLFVKNTRELKSLLEQAV